MSWPTLIFRSCAATFLTSPGESNCVVAVEGRLPTSGLDGDVLPLTRQRELSDNKGKTCEA